MKGCVYNLTHVIKSAIPKGIVLVLALIIMLNVCAISALAVGNDEEAIAEANEEIIQDTVENDDSNTVSSDELISNVSVIVSSQAIHIQKVDGSYYLFLPANADLQSLSFQIAAETAALTISGDKGKAEINADGIDITALASADENGIYSVTLSGENMEQTAIKLMKSANIPAMYITSKDADNEGRAFVDASKDNSTTGSLYLVDSEGNVICSDSLKQIKARGNTTFSNAEKKSYQIKLNKKADLINCGESGKTWVLLASYFDATQIRDKMFKDLAKTLEMEYTANCDWVDLYYDGEYRGTYLVSEKNSVGSTGIDITDLEKAYEKVNDSYGDDASFSEAYNKYGQKFVYTENLTEPEDVSGGFLLELNNTTIDEVNGFVTAQGVAFNVKSPEYCGKEALTYMSEYYQEFENAVYAQDEAGNYTGYNAETGKYFYEYCDLQSLVKMYLIQLYANNLDGFYSSFFFYKDAGGIMYAGPVWDMETTSGTGWQGTMPATYEFINSRYLAIALSKIPDFMDAVREYYDNTFKTQAMSLIGENGKVAAYAEELKASSVMNYTMWPLVQVGSPYNDKHLYPSGTTRDDVISELKTWLETRVGKLDSALAEHDHNYTLKNAKDASCTEDGYTGDKVCTVCGVIYKGTAIAAEGHDWNDSHVCTKCGFEGIDISNAEIRTYSAVYTEGTPAQCTVKGSYNGTSLKFGEGNAYDAYASYSDNTAIGMGTVTIKGQGNYYGEVVKQFKIVPAAISELKVSSISGSSVTLTWDAVPGATDYRVEYKTADGSWNYVLTTGNAVKTEITIGGLESETTYSFRAYGYAKVDGTYFSAAKYSPITEATTAHVHTTSIQNAKAATCTEDGYTGDEVCTMCDKTIKTGEAIKALGHKEVVDPAVAATCTTDGKTEGKHCSVCEAVIAAQETIPALGHSYKNGVCTVCGSADPGYKSNPFVDVKDDAYYNEAVQWAVNHDPAITDGVDATHFAPTADCTRAQAVTFLWRSAGCPTPTTKTCAFTDVKEGAYYYEAVLWAVEKGITDGTSATTFSPNEKVTRAQVVTFLYRMEGQPKVENTTCAFTDVDTNAYYYNAVLWAVANGITDGMDETHFAPTAVCNRAQIVTFIFRYDKAEDNAQ